MAHAAAVGWRTRIALRRYIADEDGGTANVPLDTLGKVPANGQGLAHSGPGSHSPTPAGPRHKAAGCQRGNLKAASMRRHSERVTDLLFPRVGPHRRSDDQSDQEAGAFRPTIPRMCTMSWASPRRPGCPKHRHDRHRRHHRHVELRAHLATHPRKKRSRKT